MSLAIQTRGLARLFPGGHGVRDLDLSVPAGSVFGFLGPNGAGKTTTIRLLLGLLRPDRGEVLLHGRPLHAERAAALAQVGALVESPALYPHLTGRDNLEVMRRLLGASPARIDEALAITTMRDAADRRVREYSLGMRQRLAIAQAMLGAPKLLILDEPANGLDPAGILDMRRLLRALAAEHGMTVFVSSHQLSEVEQVASHVAVLREGRLRFSGAMADLRARIAPRLLLRADALAHAATVLANAGEAAVAIDAETLAVVLQHRTEAQVNRLLVEAGLQVSHLVREQPSLETLFFQIAHAHEPIHPADPDRQERRAA
jgi:ABC-2 type transport system ATP-binding protein